MLRANCSPLAASPPVPPPADVPAGASIVTAAPSPPPSSSSPQAAAATARQSVAAAATARLVACWRRVARRSIAFSPVLVSSGGSPHRGLGDRNPLPVHGRPPHGPGSRRITRVLGGTQSATVPSASGSRSISTKSDRALATHDRTVPIGTSSTSAASSYCNPSTWVSTNALRRSSESAARTSSRSTLPIDPDRSPNRRAGPRWCC